MARPRKKQTRNAERSIFIWCEGKKTEPNYFEALIKSVDLPAGLASVHVLPSEHTDLVGLVKEAKKFMRKNKYDSNDEYWVVVDKDGYTKHPEGFNLAYANSINVAFSSVCFEYWLFCHFEYSTKAYSKCIEVIKESLQSHLAGYQKKSLNVFDDTKCNLNDAIKNARRVRAHCALSPEIRTTS